jgi:hypothetical protein
MKILSLSEYLYDNDDGRSTPEDDLKMRFKENEIKLNYECQNVKCTIH